MMNRGWSFWSGFCALALALTSLLFTTESRAESLITQPGAHNEYSFELEPHFVVALNGYGRGCPGCPGRYTYNEGFGPGVRASIPFMHNGPIKEINNNLAITFGVDTFFYGNGYNAWGFGVPVAAQWNFYFTDIISAFPELGLISGIVSSRYPETERRFGNRYTDFYIDPLFQLGGRFQFGKVGIIARVGYPVVSIGANFQF